MGSRRGYALAGLGRAIQSCRKAAGIKSAEALAAKTGLSVALIKNIERGTHENVGLLNLFAIADACGVSPVALLMRAMRPVAPEEIERVIEEFRGSVWNLEYLKTPATDEELARVRMDAPSVTLADFRPESVARLVEYYRSGAKPR